MQSKDNTLYYGDNLDVLRRYLDDESVNLVYLDPPFNSDKNYNVLFAEQDGSRAASQIKAFDDTWQWDQSAEATYREAVESGGKVSQVLQAFRQFIGETDMLAYLVMMAPRLVELRRILKPTGSIYLHCDPTASHYLKLLMDAVFGHENYRNEITWQRTNAHSDAKRWADVADILLYYGRSKQVTWNIPRGAHDQRYILSKYRHDDGDGRGLYRLDNMTSPHPRPNMTYEWMGFPPPPAGWRYSTDTMKRLHEEGRVWYPKSKSKRPQLKRYLSEIKGVVMGTIWTDIPPLNSQAQERLGYPTQKPETLLERIVAASSGEGDLVLDPFCGCGTAIAVAQRLNRRWIGIDITHLAINLIRHRLKDAFGDEAKYSVVGEPASREDAMALAEQDPYQFQWWALGLVGARPVEQKKGADKGIDGRLYFHDEAKGGKTKQVVLSVKAGNTGVAHVRDLRGVLDREKAEIGVLISMESPTKPMRVEATSAGFYHSFWWDRDYPKIQLLTVGDLLNGKAIDMPAMRHTSVTFKKAPKVKRKGDTTEKSIDFGE